MNFIDIIFISFALAMDAFAVSIASGSHRFMRNRRSAIRLAFHLGLFQFIMPVIGWYIGSGISNIVNSFSQWLAFGLLLIIGIKMIFESFQSDSEFTHKSSDPSKGGSLIMLSIATSIDAFGVGLSLAFLNINIWYSASIIGFITASLSIIGIIIGNKLGSKFGKKMEIAGGILLILIGLRILFTH